jgi:hypothetical protein
VEFFIKSNFLVILDTAFRTFKKAIYLIISLRISDHQKEKVLPKYALKIMISSIQLLIILLSILLLFVILSFFIDDFLIFTFSLIGILETLIFAFGYSLLRKTLTR